MLHAQSVKCGSGPYPSNMPICGQEQEEDKMVNKHMMTECPAGTRRTEKNTQGRYLLKKGCELGMSMSRIRQACESLTLSIENGYPIVSVGVRRRASG